MGLRLGEDRLSEALARIGNTPLVQRREGADELCYRAEVPFEETWVVLSSGAAGNWDVLTTFRVLSSPPVGMTCRPTPLVTSTIAVEGIRKGMTEDELRARFNVPAGMHTTPLAFPLLLLARGCAARWRTAASSLSKSHSSDSNRPVITFTGDPAQSAGKPVVSSLEDDHNAATACSRRIRAA